ncbi:(deoxy)nucleoside triphosphate pyrophosphohydrolase [Sporomusa acidovorans]|uniref:8-oxo-dGTP diphosphatase n=1 Tax=Sporomusa acidovorans (strain ATCC 49682 / DSM 3132 / Mol) TaxID=1123286 RepID=A0ABZ3J1W4_SPOA4|nr:(deoxy)nucleoside triphosphate pyrophosphohydrolase [Sporomusa acidovorans]OZC19729.1 CTP pyrophosphohydrolase [Sporomusa acidovorans DSM 3132]SDF76091.1 8-oxo-dGTP diphosphatase [Sporomusa acidovorans]
MKEVVAGLIKKNNKLLIARRTFPPELNGKWEFPGGKIERNETPQQGLEREILEEFNMRVCAKGNFISILHEHARGPINLLFYWAEWIAGDPVLIDHDMFVWVDIGDLNQYEFAPADSIVAQKLQTVSG